MRTVGVPHFRLVNMARRALVNRQRRFTPLFKNLADDPRYKVFLRKMNLPE